MKLEPYGCEFVGFFCVRDKGSIALNLTSLAHLTLLECRLFSPDLRVERATGTSLPIQTTTAQIYRLLATTFSPTEYTFTVKSATNTLGSLRFMMASLSLGANPIDQSRDFVREQYRDFLAREPDAPGWDFWTREITLCGTDATCVDRKPVNTSGAFFLSDEFQTTGYYVYRVYRGSLGRVPYYSEFTLDVCNIAAGIFVENRLSPEAINRNRREFAREFVERPEFLAIYGTL